MLAPAIERQQPPDRQSLLALLALSDAQLCRAVGVTDIRGTLRRARATGTPTGVDPVRAVPRVAGAGLTADAGPPTNASDPATALCRHEPGYPVALAQLPSAPAVLHATGDAERLGELLAAPTVALLGERRHTGYAHRIAFALARDLTAAGVTVVSGLHQGIDGIAHHGALHARGRAIAVTGSAPEIAHPRQLDHLHRCIAARGAVVSEFPPGFAPPRPWCFLASQLIIAALADVVVIVEAGEQSSTLLAAQVAADLGHDVAVVPGRIEDPGSRGTFALLRDGAHPVACAQDVLEMLPSAGRLEEYA
jgi:DNA processing protein